MHSSSVFLYAFAIAVRIGFSVAHFFLPDSFGFLVSDGFVHAFRFAGTVDFRIGLRLVALRPDRVRRAGVGGTNRRHAG